MRFKPIVYRNFISKFFIFIGVYIGSCAPVFAQNQTLADSLENIYTKGIYSQNNKLEILKKLAEYEVDIEKKIYYSNELVSLGKSQDSSYYTLAGFLQKGNAYRLKGDLNEALKNFFEAAQLADNKNNIREVGIVNVAIADVYSIMGNHKRAIDYYKEAISTLGKVTDSISLGSALLNAGDEYFNYGEVDSALIYYQQSGKIFEAKHYKTGVAYNLGNMGLVYAKLGKNEKAEKNISEAVELLKKAGDYYPICDYLTGMSEIYMEKNEDSIAMNFTLRSLDLANMYGFKDQISKASLLLSQLKEKSGNIPEAFTYYKNYVTYNDSVRNVSSAQEMANQRADHEVFKKQAEVNLLMEKRKNQRLAMISIAIFTLLIVFIAFGLYRRNHFIKKTSIVIEREKNRSDHLLLNILPEETARELKENGMVKAKKFESVTVLFADFKDFSQYAEKLPPEKLIKNIDYYFSSFDKIIEKYGIEKIKTLGDSYMAATGLPFPTQDHAQVMLLAAFEIAKFVGETKENNLLPEANLDIRIGIHSGPVVAGVVGTKKFAYDIWGDTVNIASRMESNSEAGKINISENTHKLIEDGFVCEYRGEIEVRNHGTLKMYYVERPK